MNPSPTEEPSPARAPAVEIVPNPIEAPRNNLPNGGGENQPEGNDEEGRGGLLECMSFFLTKDGATRFGQAMWPFARPAIPVVAVEDSIPEKKVPILEINKFPDIVLVKIFSKLPWAEVKECRLVCRRWEILIYKTRLTQDKILCQFRGTISVTHFRKKSWDRILKKINPFSKVIPKLPFNTLRLTRVYSIDWVNFDRWIFANRISDFCLMLNQVKRVEYDATVIMATARARNRLFEFWRGFFPLINRLPMLEALVIYQDWILEPFPATHRVFDDEVQSKFTRLIQKYKPEWKTLSFLTKFEYDVSLPRISEYLVMLKGIGHFCRVLVDVKIIVNYEEVWLSHAGQINLFMLIGTILEVNARTLKRFHLGSKREYKGSLPRIEGMGSATPSETYCMSLSSNTMFESLLDEMWSGKWAEFRLNSLEHLTLIFPIPVLPSTKISSHLSPFVASCKNLRTVRIQPMVKLGRTLNNFAYVDAIFDKLAKKNTWDRWGRHYNPLLKPSITFFSKDKSFEWKKTRDAAYYSFVDLEYNKVARLDDGTPVTNKTVHWRNVCIFTFLESPIPAVLPGLSILIISQDKTKCSREQIICIGDQEMQTILRYGKNLKAIVLNCDLKSMTTFGFSGLWWRHFKEHTSEINFLDYVRKFSKGSSILDLKYLKRVVLLGLFIHGSLPLKNSYSKYRNLKAKMEAITKRLSMGVNQVPLIEPTFRPKVDHSRKLTDKEIIKSFFVRSKFDFFRVTFENARDAQLEGLGLAGRAYDFTRYLNRTKTSRHSDIFNQLMSSHIWD